MIRLLRYWPLAVALLLAQCAAAQEVSPAPKVYAYVEQMPALPGGGGQQAIVAAIGQNFHYPAEALRERVGGRIFVQFIVAASGQVEHVHVIKSLRADCDSAAVQAVRMLPLFEPGRQKGQPVPVSFTVPLTLRPPTTPAPAK